MNPITIRFAGYQPPASIHNRAAGVFAEALKERLGAALAFDFEGNIIESGHNAADLLTLVENGDLTMCYFSASYLAQRVPEIALLDLPFVFDNRAQAYAVLDGPLGQILAQKLQAATGYKLLGWWDNGFRHISNKIRPIRRPEDCQGLRIRTLFSDIHQQVFRLLGFEPIPLDVKDLIAQVNSGELDAQENPLTNYYNFNIQQQHRYLTLSSHFFGAAVLLCNADSYASWSVDMQNQVHAAAAQATAAQRDFATAEDAAVMAKLDPEQIDITHLTTAERARFVATVAPLLEQQRTLFDPQLFAYLEQQTA